MNSTVQQSFTCCGQVAKVRCSAIPALTLVYRGGDNLVQIRRGRPRISVEISDIEALLELGVPIVDISRYLGMSRTTLWRRLSELNVCISRFTDVDDATLDSVRNLKNN